LRQRIKEMEKRMKEMEERFVARSTREAVLPKSSTRATVAPSATTVDNLLFETPIAPNALLRNVPSWAQVAAKGKKRKVEEEVGRAPDPVVRQGNVVPMIIKVGGVRWEDRIGGTVEPIREADVEVCGEGQ